MMELVRKFVGHVLPGVMRPLRILWNEIIAFVFFALAAIATPSAWRTAKTYDGDAESFFRMLLTGLFALVMLCFGVGSWRRARKIARS
jgi:hypothetical protein